MATMAVHSNGSYGEADAPAAQRWLIAGDPSWPDALRKALPADAGDVQLVHVPTFLAALGDLGQASADVIIGPAATLGAGATTSTLRALRELAPQAKLLLLADESDVKLAEAAVMAGFDGWMTLPPTREKLAQALSEQSAPDAADSRGVGMPSAEAGGEVGDVDLINCILSGTGVRTMATQLMRDRSALADLAIAADEGEVPEGHASTRITLRGRDFGVLHAPMRDGTAPDALAGWAGWLAHWLALDEQVSLLKDLSMRDALTGVWNRRYFDRFLKRILDWAGRERSQVTLLVFDIDDFKVYNDRYGHAAGDDILRECSKLMLSVVREHDVVARIGGDEFAVIFWDADPRQAPRQPNSRHPEDVVSAATRFQQAICSHQFPKLLNEAPGTLTISGGLASFPWDGRTPQELLDKADEMAMHSKRQGKNAIKFGPGAERVCQMIQRDHAEAPAAEDNDS